MNFTAVDFLAILPILFLVGWACTLLLVDLFLKNKGVTALLAIIGLAATLAITLLSGGVSRLAFGGMISQDGFARFVSAVVLGSGIIGIGLSFDYLKRLGINQGEYYTMVLFSVTGMMLMAYAADLIVVFLALELFSIPLYILAGFARPRRESEESAMKYFLIGAFSSAIMVYGIGLVYGATGTTGLGDILAAWNTSGINANMFVIGGGLLLVGLGFKVGAVPFHMWTPDVYQGAPSTVTAFMAVGAKAGGFAALLRIFVSAFGGHYAVSTDLTTVIWGIAVLTMIVGNVLAISQRNIKRLLAYSSISHAGYIMMAFVSFSQESVARDTVASALFYLVAFAVTSFGAWAVVISLERDEDGEDGLRRGLDLEDYAGLGQRYPLMALAMTVFMLSFTGLPPTLGFAGKLFLFRATLEGGYVGLAVVGVLTSLVSAYYYLRVVIIMYMQDGEPQVHRERWAQVTLLASAAGTVLLTIFASPLFKWAADSVLNLF
jgi:NADH-quinone oxidoreductase subunit N